MKLFLKLGTKVNIVCWSYDYSVEKVLSSIVEAICGRKLTHSNDGSDIKYGVDSYNCTIFFNYCSASTADF